MFLARFFSFQSDLVMFLESWNHKENHLRSALTFSYAYAFRSPGKWKHVRVWSAADWIKKRNFSLNRFSMHVLSGHATRTRAQCPSERASKVHVNSGYFATCHFQKWNCVFWFLLFLGREFMFLNSDFLKNFFLLVRWKQVGWGLVLRSNHRDYWICPLNMSLGTYSIIICLNMSPF